MQLNIVSSVYLIYIIYMKKFNFKLDSVLKYRKILCDQAKDNLAKAHKERQDTETELNTTIDEEYKQREKFRKEQVVGKMNIRHVLDRLSYMAHLAGHKRQKKHELVENEKKVNQQRDIYVEKSKEQKVLDKLKEKQKVDYIKKIGSLEQKQIDESGINKHTRDKEE